MTRFIIIVALIFFSTMQMFSQNISKNRKIERYSARIFGVITDKKTNENLPFVTIALYQNSKFIKSTTTDFEGRYSIYIGSAEKVLETTQVFYYQLVKFKFLLIFSTQVQAFLYF